MVWLDSPLNGWFLNARCRNQPLDCRIGEIFVGQGHEVVVAPGSVDVEVFAQVSFFAESVARQHFPAADVFRQVRGHDAVHSDASECVVNAECARRGADAFAGMSREDPVADGAVGAGAVLDVAQGQLPDKFVIEFNRKGHEAARICFSTQAK